MKILVSLTQILRCVAYLFIQKKDVIPGRVNPKELGETEVRDPDALPPRNTLEAIGTNVHSFFKGIGGGNVVYAIKAGVMTSSRIRFLEYLCSHDFYSANQPHILF